MPGDKSVGDSRSSSPFAPAASQPHAAFLAQDVLIPHDALPNSERLLKQFLWFDGI
jgi:hypothetical protein